MLSGIELAKISRLNQRRNARPFALFVATAFFMLQPLAVGAQEMTCSECYQKNRPVCEQGCDGGTRFGFSECADRCVDTACGVLCGKTQIRPPAQRSGANIKSTESGGGLNAPEGAEGTAEDRGNDFTSSDVEVTDAGPCGKCIRSMTSSCHNECAERDPETISECRPRCAKRKCADKCQLPGSVGKDTPLPRPADCAKCKHLADMTCRQRCGENRERAGYTACLISCGEEKCLDTCSPSSYE